MKYKSARDILPSELISQIQKKIQKGKSLSVIADELEETVDTIRPLYERVQAELVIQK